MQTLIDTASTTFSTTIGFGWDEVITEGVDLLGLAFGTGLGFFTEALPVLLVVAVVYLVYKIAKMGWHKAI